MTTERARSGKKGERDAEAFLLARGLTLVERNYRCRSGEIDLIMTAPADDGGELLVFVEVRRRGSGAQVSALDSVDANKQRRLITAARYFLLEQPRWSEHRCRFDVVALEAADDRMIWVPAAFET
jgi:putative endonuclease